jgi:L-alanine-DL-glutamate epimerase-like enolase superfamily enzyme
VLLALVTLNAFNHSPQFIIKNGVLPVPTGPGMGVDFDPDFIKKSTLVKNVTAG